MAASSRQVPRKDQSALSIFGYSVVAMSVLHSDRQDVLDLGAISERQDDARVGSAAVQVGPVGTVSPESRNLNEQLLPILDGLEEMEMATAENVRASRRSTMEGLLPPPGELAVTLPLVAVDKPPRHPTDSHGEADLINVRHIGLNTVVATSQVQCLSHSHQGVRVMVVVHTSARAIPCLDPAMIARHSGHHQATAQRLQHLDGVVHDPTSDTNLLRQGQPGTPGVLAPLRHEPLDVIPQPCHQDLIGTTLPLDLLSRQVGGRGRVPDGLEGVPVRAALPELHVTDQDSHPTSRRITHARGTLPISMGIDHRQQVINGDRLAGTLTTLVGETSGHERLGRVAVLDPPEAGNLPLPRVLPGLLQEPQRLPLGSILGNLHGARGETELGHAAALAMLRARNVGCLAHGKESLKVAHRSSILLKVRIREALTLCPMRASAITRRSAGTARSCRAWR